MQLSKKSKTLQIGGWTGNLFVTCVTMHDSEIQTTELVWNTTPGQLCLNLYYTIYTLPLTSCFDAGQKNIQAGCQWQCYIPLLS